MTEFNDLELNDEIPSMTEEEAKKTLSEFMESHQTNRTAYDELSTELDETETEYKEKLDEKEDLISDFKEDRAEEAAEYVNMPAELLADRFSFDEIDQIIEEGAEFSEEEEGDPEDDPEDGDGSLTTFSDKPEKGKGGSKGAGGSGDRDHARSVLQSNGFTVGGGN